MMMLRPAALTLACLAVSVRGMTTAPANLRPRTIAPRSRVFASDMALVDSLSARAKLALQQAQDALQLTFASPTLASQRLREAQEKLASPGAGDETLERWQAMRKAALARMLALDRDQYLTTVTQLGDSIPRSDLPNRQDVPLPARATAEPVEDGMIPDCTLANVSYSESPLDVLLLKIFRKFVQDEIGWASNKPAMEGLAEEGRYYMLRASEEDQQQMVVNVLRRLFTPAGPPFYRIFMSGIWGDRQLGPWFWAPALTAFVTPPFFKFLVGPSTPNYRADGQLGGLVVEKCRFLQESGCKGLCVHQCKLPAQRFFAEDLGLQLTVSPNFETQECQWSFGEEPLPVAEDLSMPAGCLSGCPSRVALTEAKACNSCS